MITNLSSKKTVRFNVFLRYSLPPPVIITAAWGLFRSNSSIYPLTSKSIPFITPFKIASCVFFPTYPCSMEHFTNGRLAVNSFSARKRIPSPGEIFPPRNSPSALTKSYVIAVPESITSNSRPGKRNAPPTQPAIRSTPKVFGVSYPKRIGKGISDDTSQKKVETSRNLSRTSAEIRRSRPLANHNIRY